MKFEIREIHEKVPCVCVCDFCCSSIHQLVLAAMTEQTIGSTTMAHFGQAQI
jgi:hypothetical protein